MARKGEGDARWIVEERPDSTNVNNWHWTERNATPFSKERMNVLFKQLAHDNDEGSWKVKEVKTLDGDSTISNRKGKLIYLYEWKIVLEYSGTLAGSTTEHTGTIECSNLSDENDANELDILVRSKSDAKNSDALKAIVRKTGVPMFRDKCVEYMKDLRTEFSKGMILPTKDGINMNAQTTANSKNNKKSAIQTSFEINDRLIPPHEKTNRNVKSVVVEVKEKFKVDVSEIYNTLILQERVSAFTRSPCEVDSRVGGSFSIMGGNITGKFLKLVENKKIVQEWKMKEWDEGITSHVTIDLTPTDSGCSLSLKQTGVPDTDMSRTKEGWTRYYFGPIKQIFGFGSQMY